MAAAKKSKTKIKRRAQSIASSKQQNEKKKMKHTFRKQHFSSLCNGCLLLVLGVTFLFGACADDDLANEQPGKHTGTTVAFNVSDAQMEALVQAGAKGITRGLSPQPLSSADLAPRKLEATGSNPHDFCLIESTVEGINPVKPAEGTRAEIIKTATLGNFSSIGYRAASSAAAANPSTALLWFHGEKTNSDGTLVNRYDWDWPVNVYGRFYAVSPEATAANGITLSPSNSAQVPYVDFEVKQDVEQQVDLMTACSGEVHYIHGNDPTSNLKFRHALAAVKFSIGSNLSPVIIKKIELKNVKYKGRYRLPNKADGSDATWTSVENATTTMVLDNININAAEMPNTMLAGALDPDPNNHNRIGRENYTFLMIPQVMPAKTAANAIKAVIYYQDGATTKTITIPLTGEWKAGVTKEYKLSQKNSSWGYQLTLTENSKTFDYRGNALGWAQFQVKSYREGGATQQPVPWKISKYEEWDYATNSWVDKGTTKPDWLGDITDHGNGSTAAEACNTAVKTATVTDQLAAYNQVLKDAAPKGTAGNPYNLANPRGNGSMMDIEESANCYLISAPGHYCLPLVYGNSYKNNIVNGHSFRSTQPASTPYLLKTFKDHRGMDMAGARISAQLGTYLNGASIVWMDQPNLIRSSSLSVVNNIPTNLGSMDFLEFEVKQEDIHNGNAVIAAKLGNTIVWSWHLWFDHADALDKITTKNPFGTYQFTRNTLGQVHTKYEKTTYDQPRKARLTVEQQAGNGGNNEKSQVIIVQNPGSTEEDLCTYYQFGRKDAFPGTDTFYDGTSGVNPSTTGFQKAPGAQTIGTTIKNPGTMYCVNPGPFSPLRPDQYSTPYYNTWSINHHGNLGLNSVPVVKTVYDPCPAGFCMPTKDAFFTFSNGARPNAPSNSWDNGIHFYTEKSSTSTTPTIFFPALGLRSNADGSLMQRTTYGFYWAAEGTNTYYGNCCNFQNGFLDSYAYKDRSLAFAVRPMADN